MGPTFKNSGSTTIVRTLAVGSVVFLGGLACSKEPTTAVQYYTRETTVTSAPLSAPATAQPTPAPAPMTPPPTPEATEVRITKSIQDACGITDEDLRAAHFAFDSSKLDKGGVALFDRIGSCINDGKLGDQKIELVGFTDDRGTAEYNMALGQRRADAGKSELVRSGVSSDRLTSESRGKEEATGTDEQSRALDRRVEVRVQGEESQKQDQNDQKNPTERP
jgi:peptidoglycan-associated lipoprotein